MPEDCFCPVDVDGQCVPCKKEMLANCGMVVSILNEHLRQMEAIIKSTQERIGELKMDPSCHGCAGRYADLGISALIPTLGDSSEFVARGIVQGIC